MLTYNVYHVAGLFIGTVRAYNEADAIRLATGNPAVCDGWRYYVEEASEFWLTSAR